MAMRALVLFVLAVLVAGCAAEDPRVALCRSVLNAVVGPPLRILEVEASPGERTVTLAFARPGEELRRVLACRFAGERLGADATDLVGVSIDGSPLSEVRMILLRRLLGLATPAETLPDQTAGVPADRAFGYFLQQVVNGVTLGAVIGLIALGYTLVYGITGTIQFAYGEIFMVGAYLTIILFLTLQAAGVSSIGVLLAIIFLVAAPVTALHGLTIERLVYRPLRGAGMLTPLIAAIGVSIVLQSYVALTHGTRARFLPPLLLGRWTIHDSAGFTVLVGEINVLIVVAALGLAAALGGVMIATKAGRLYRACAENGRTAALLGIDVHRVVAASFAVGAALAALGGLAVALYYGEADPAMGYLIGFKALTAALLGGFGSLPGALIGGMVIGVFEVMWSAYINLAYKDAAIFTLLVLVLVFRPEGLLGTFTGAAAKGAAPWKDPP